MVVKKDLIRATSAFEIILLEEPNLLWQLNGTKVDENNRIKGLFREFRELLDTIVPCHLMFFFLYTNWINYTAKVLNSS